jgi:hypothetical protein
MRLTNHFHLVSGLRKREIRSLLPRGVQLRGTTSTSFYELNSTRQRKLTRFSTVKNAFMRNEVLNVNSN